VAFDNITADAARLDRAAALVLARGARRLLVKTKAGVVRLDRLAAPWEETEIVRALVHDDGFLNVPVLILGDLVVRGYTEDLYREALGPETSA